MPTSRIFIGNVLLAEMNKKQEVGHLYRKQGRRHLRFLLLPCIFENMSVFGWTFVAIEKSVVLPWWYITPTRATLPLSYQCCDRLKLCNGDIRGGKYMTAKNELWELKRQSIGPSLLSSPSIQKNSKT